MTFSSMFVCIIPAGTETEFYLLLLADRTYGHDKGTIMF